MFGLNTYVIYAGIAAILFIGGFVNGCSYHQSKAEQVIREKEHEYQQATNKIRKAKDEKINSINDQLLDAISELHERPGRAGETGNGQTTSGCNGSKLYAEDAEFLTREAARADKVRVGLEACYSQYEALK